MMLADAPKLVPSGKKIKSDDPEEPEVLTTKEEILEFFANER